MVCFILFLIRLRLGVKKNEPFKFSNQKTDFEYYIDSRRVWKVDNSGNGIHIMQSNVSLNWLLNSDCKIIKLED